MWLIGSKVWSATLRIDYNVSNVYHILFILNFVKIIQQVLVSAITYDYNIWMLGVGN